MRPYAHDYHQLGDSICAHNQNASILNWKIEFIQSDQTIGNKEETSSNENLPKGGWIALAISLSGCSHHAYNRNNVDNHRNLQCAKIRIDHVECEGCQKINWEIDKEGFYKIHIKKRFRSFLSNLESYDITDMGK